MTRLLVADDDRQIRAIFKPSLRRSVLALALVASVAGGCQAAAPTSNLTPSANPSPGFEPTRAVANGASAVRAHDQRPADLLITDLFMPERDGLETVEYFRARHPSMPIIAISGWKPGQRADYLEVARVAGADAVLRKPFTIDELLAQVQDVASARISMQQVPRAG